MKKYVKNKFLLQRFLCISGVFRLLCSDLSKRDDHSFFMNIEALLVVFMLCVRRNMFLSKGPGQTDRQVVGSGRKVNLCRDLR